MRTAAFLLAGAASGLAVLSAGSPGAAAPIPKHLMKGDDTEQSKLQGRWKVESLRLGGQDLGGVGFDMVMEIRGDEMTATVNQGGRQTTTGKLKFDTADGVKRLTMTNTRQVGGDGQPQGQQPDSSVGYVLDGDKLTMAMRAGGGNGQVADPTKPGKDDVVMVLTRVKPEPAPEPRK